METPDKDKTRVPLFGAKPIRISQNIQLRYVYEENGWWKLHIAVSDNVTSSELRNAWSSIDQGNFDLINFQGSDPHEFIIAFQYELNEQKKNNSYTILMFDTNFDALTYIYCALEHQDLRVKQFALNTFRNLLAACGIKNKEIFEWEKFAKEKINNNEIPWGIDKGPIATDHIKYVLKRFKIWKKKSLSVIQSKNKYDMMYTIWMFFIARGSWYKVQEKLINSSDIFKGKYFDRYQKRFSSIIKRYFLSQKNP